MNKRKYYIGTFENEDVALLVITLTKELYEYHQEGANLRYSLDYIFRTFKNPAEKFKYIKQII